MPSAKAQAFCYIERHWPQLLLGIVTASADLRHCLRQISIIEVTGAV